MSYIDPTSEHAPNIKHDAISTHVDGLSAVALHLRACGGAVEVSQAERTVEQPSSEIVAARAESKRPIYTRCGR